MSEPASCCRYSVVGFEGPLGLLVVLVGLALFAWGCMSYMRGKGHHPAWGILGVFSLIGLVILFFFPDRHRGG